MQINSVNNYHGIRIRPDITVVVDWALKINHLSIYGIRVTTATLNLSAKPTPDKPFNY